MAFERQDISIIGSNISKYRKLKKYTQKQLGDLLDVNPKTVSKWENGTVGPDITILKSLADALDVSVEELLSGIKNKNKKYKTSVVLNFVLSFIVFILVSVIAYMYINRYEVYEFKSNHEQFNIEGYIVSGHGESRFVFEDFSYITKEREDAFIKELEVKIYIGKELVHEVSTGYNEKVSLVCAVDSLIIGSVNSFIEFDNGNNKKLSLIVKYLNLSDEIRTETIDLKTNIS